MSEIHDPAQPESPNALGDEGNHPTPGNDRADPHASEPGDDIGNAVASVGNTAVQASEAHEPEAAPDEEADEESPEDSIGNRLDGPPTHLGHAGTVAQPLAAGAGKKRRRDRRKGGHEGHAEARAAGGDPNAAANANARRPFHTGDKVRAKLVSVGSDGAIVDLWGKEQGVIDLREITVSGAPEPQPGDHVDVVVLQDGSRGGNVVVTRDSQRAEHGREMVAQAFNSNEPIEGLVTGVNRGGLEVDLSGMRGFCPSSQIDVRFPPTVNPKALVLTRQTFKVTSLHDDGKEAIVSRRAIVEQEVRARAEEARANIQVGSIVKGRVVSVKEYGVFVDLGGIEGMIHISELTHNRSARPSDVVKVGDEVEAKVLRISGGTKPDAAHAEEPHAEGEAAAVAPEEAEASVDSAAGVPTAEAEPAQTAEGATVSETGKDKPAKGGKKDKKKPRGRPVESLPRVVLSRRAIEPDPWSGIEKKFPAGSVHQGKVARMQPFGAFVELLPGVDGLLHVSELGDGKRIEHPNEVLKEGQSVNVRVERVEKGAKRISLSMLPEGVTEEQLKTAIVPRMGMIVKAKVVEHESFGGMWAQIEGAIGKTGRGFIAPQDSNQPRGTDLRRAIPVGTEVAAKIVELERGRPKLSIRAALQDEERQAYRQYQREATSKPVGVSLADKLRAKLGDLTRGGGQKGA